MKKATSNKNIAGVKYNTLCYITGNYSSATFKIKEIIQQEWRTARKKMLTFYCD